MGCFLLGTFCPQLIPPPHLALQQSQRNASSSYFLLHLIALSIICNVCVYLSPTRGQRYLSSSLLCPQKSA